MYSFLGRFSDCVCSSTHCNSGSQWENAGELDAPLRSALARQGSEDDVPERGGDAVSVAVILEVVAHVLLPQAFPQLRLRGVVMQVIVGVVVGEVADDQAGEDRVGG